MKEDAGKNTIPAWFAASFMLQLQHVYSRNFIHFFGGVERPKKNSLFGRISNSFEQIKDSFEQIKE